MCFIKVGLLNIMRTVKVYYRELRHQLSNGFSAELVHMIVTYYYEFTVDEYFPTGYLLVVFQ